MSEQLTTEEKDDVAEGRLDIKEARERAVERGRETGNIAGSCISRQVKFFFSSVITQNIQIFFW